MFVAGALYLLSIIPENANSVSKSVVVDAERNKMVAIFDNDTDPSADEKTLRYLTTGELDQAATPQAESGEQGGAERPATGPTSGEQPPSRTPDDVQRRLSF